MSKGNGKAGMILFMGSSVQVHLMNEVFGLELQQDYKEGPYYKNERNVKVCFRIKRILVFCDPVKKSFFSMVCHFALFWTAIVLSLSWCPAFDTEELCCHCRFSLLSPNQASFIGFTSVRLILTEIFISSGHCAWLTRQKIVTQTDMSC